MALPIFDEAYHGKRFFIIGHGSPWGNDLSEELPDTRPLGLELVELRVVRVAFGMLRKDQKICLEDGKMGGILQVKGYIYVHDVIWVHHEYSWIFSLYHLNGYWCYSFYGWVSLIHKESFPTLPLQKRFGNDGRCTPGEPNMDGRCTSGLVWHRWVWYGRHLHCDAPWCRWQVGDIIVDIAGQPV